jgi:hypothetical protein
MQDYRVETRVSGDRALIIRGLPFEAGDEVEVIVRRSHKRPGGTDARYPLRGTPIRYADPFGCVAAEDWEALR